MEFSCINKTNIIIVIQNLHTSTTSVKRFFYLEIQTTTLVMKTGFLDFLAECNARPGWGAFDLPESESGFEIMILIHRFT